MMNHDYLKEVGLAPTEKKVPWPYVVVLFVVLLVGIVLFARHEMKDSPPPPRASA